MMARLSTHPPRRLQSPRAVPLAILFAGLFVAPLDAQYISPGTAVSTSAIPGRDAIEEGMNDAAWNLGRIRIGPWLGLRDASFVTSEVEGGSRTDDFTLTAGAGLRAYLPTGKAILTAHVLPEYVWWQDNDDKSRLNGRYGVAAFGFFNRLTAEASLRLTDTQSFFSTEIRELTTTRTDTARLAVEVEVGSRLSLFAIAERGERESQEDESEIFPLLDREEDRLTMGLRYRAPGGWSFGLGYEDSETTFSEAARNLSNSGSATLFDLGFDGSRLNFRLALAARDLEGDEGSEFGELDATTGSLEALWSVSPKSTLLTYAQRRQTFSVETANAFTFEERQGARVDYSLSRVNLGFFAELGDDEFETVGAGGVGRVDDVTALGLDVRFAVGDLTQLTLRLEQTSYDSNRDGFDRDTTDIRFAVELRSLAQKLRLGQAGGDW